jgi:hypothetical protein
MEQEAFDGYSRAFVQALAAFDDVMGVVALGSTADSRIQDSWSDHDFAVVLRDGDPGQFLGDVSWMPKTEKIIARARHGGISSRGRTSPLLAAGLAVGPREVAVRRPTSHARTRTRVGY